MPKRAILSVVVILASATLFPQGLRAFLPAKLLPAAARFLAAAGEASAAIESRRGAARRAQLAAEAAALESYSLIAASRSGQGPWAKPDGSALSSAAPALFEAARASSRAAARELADSGQGGAPGKKGISPTRAAAEESLGGLILSSGIGEKAALGLEKYLLGKSGYAAKLFPEAAEIAVLLRKAGAGGKRAAAAIAAHHGPDEAARSLLAARSSVLALAPEAGSLLSRLEAVHYAYVAWLSAAPFAAYPGDLGSASAEDRSVLAAGVLAVSLLQPGRAAALLAAMAEGDGRDAASAASAHRLAEAWDRSPASGRRALASLCGLGESAIARFSASYAASEVSLRITQAAKAPQSPDPIPVIAAINALVVAIADEEIAGAAASATEPALLFLEKPELASAARAEARYADLCAEISRRLSSIYARAAEDASAGLEASALLAKAAALALGSIPTGIVVRAIDLPLRAEESGRRIAFFAVASDSKGDTISIPISAEAAGAEYSAAFSRAAGIRPGKLPPSKAEAEALLATYGQVVLTAYDPEGSRESMLIGIYPRVAKGIRIEAMSLELALLGGWKP